MAEALAKITIFLHLSMKTACTLILNIDKPVKNINNNIKIYIDIFIKAEKYKTPKICHIQYVKYSAFIYSTLKEENNIYGKKQEKMCFYKFKS